ncbi:hypothetical protein DL93DRAFT_2103001 [Clavulina sp. PMI_390]|nr:hypothetical protein DL93DRAFT_2103001 [Clavulina sp. PMI_390]
MNQLPAEILADIMLAGVLLFRDREIAKLAYYRVTVSSVSSRWRQIALSTSSFWSNIKHEPNYAYEEAIWLLIKPEAYRIRTFEMFGRLPTHHILPLDGHYPALRTISVNRPPGSPSDSQGEAVFVATSTALNLTSLQLTAISLSVLQTMPGAKLKSFTMLYWSKYWSPIHHLLCGCPELVRCIFRCEILESGSTFQPILLPHLTFLEIEEPRLLLWLSVPSLKELVCNYEASQLTEISTPHHASNHLDRVAQFKLQSLELDESSKIEIFSMRAGLPFWEVALEHVTKLVLRRGSVVPLAFYLSELKEANIDSMEGFPESVSLEGKGSGLSKHFPSLQSFEIANCFINEFPGADTTARHLGHLLEVRPGMILTCDLNLVERLGRQSPALRGRVLLTGSRQ